MGSISVILRTSKKKIDGTCPLAIRLIKQRRTKFVFLGHYIKEDDWDDAKKRVKKGHPNSNALNRLIIKKLSEASDIIMEAEADNAEISGLKIKSKIKNLNLGSFCKVAEEHLIQLEKLHKYSQLSREKAALKYFKKFLENPDSGFNVITVQLLRRYLTHLKIEYNLTERSAMNHLIFIRTIYNKGILCGYADIRNYPFGPGKLQIKFPETFKIGLTADEIVRVENLWLPPYSFEWHAKNIWLCSFYFAGIRCADIIKLKWKDFKDGRLYYKMGKNGKIVSLKVPDKVKTILEFYEKDKGDNIFVFPYIKNADQNADPKKLFGIVRYSNRLINRRLVVIARLIEIDKPLTMHIARHSFGNIAGDRIQPQLLQKLYRHTDLKTTIGYQANFIFKEADEALETVLKY